VRLDPKYRHLGYITHGHLLISQETLARMSPLLAAGLHFPDRRTVVNMKPGETVIEHVPVSVPAAEVVLQGDLSMPSAPRGIVLFAHGSGSSRHSPRNRYVAEVLNQTWAY
jgi:hypothetical protein